jgi:hypothetical protein
LGPPPPYSPFRPGVRVSPRGPCFPQGPGGLHVSELPALLLDFFLASIPASRGPEARASRSTSRRSGPGFQASMLSVGQGLVSGHPLYFPHCFHGTGGQGARLSGARASSMLSYFQGARGKASSMLSGGKAFRLSGGHAARLSGFFLTSRPAFIFQEAFRGFQEALLPGGQG